MILLIFFEFVLVTSMPIVNIAIANILVTKYQSGFIEKHHSEKGMFMPASKAVLPCISGFFFYAVPMLIIDGYLYFNF